MKISEFLRNLPSDDLAFSMWSEWAEILGRPLTVEEVYLVNNDAKTMTVLMADMAAAYEGVLDVGPDARSEPPVARESDEPCLCDSCRKRRVLVTVNRQRISRGQYTVPLPETFPHTRVTKLPEHPTPTD